MHALWNVMSHNLDSPFHKSIVSGIQDVRGSLAHIDDENSLAWTNTTNREVLTSRKRVLIVCMRYEGEDRLETHIDACNMIELLVSVKSQAEITVLTDCHATAQQFQSYLGVQVIHTTSAERISATLDSMHREKNALLCLFGHGDRGAPSSREPKGHEQFRVGQDSAVTDEVIGRLMEAWQHSNNVAIIGTCRAEGLLTAKNDTPSVFKATASRGIGPAVMDRPSGSESFHSAPTVQTVIKNFPVLTRHESETESEVEGWISQYKQTLLQQYKGDSDAMAQDFARTQANVFILEHKYQIHCDMATRQIGRENHMLNCLERYIQKSNERANTISTQSHVINNLKRENETLRAQLGYQYAQTVVPRVLPVVLTERHMKISSGYDEGAGRFKNTLTMLPTNPDAGLQGYCDPTLLRTCDASTRLLGDLGDTQSSGFDALHEWRLSIAGGHAAQPLVARGDPAASAAPAQPAASAAPAQPAASAAPAQPAASAAPAQLAVTSVDPAGSAAPAPPVVPSTGSTAASDAVSQEGRSINSSRSSLASSLVSMLGFGSHAASTTAHSSTGSLSLPRSGTSTPPPVSDVLGVMEARHGIV